MAIAFLNAGNTGQTAGGTHSVSITVPVGTDILWVNGWSTTAPTGCTLAGNALTAIDSQTVTGTQTSKLWYIISPPSGSQTLAVTGGSSETGSLWSAYSGAKQTGIPDSSAKNSGTSITTLTLTTTVVTTSWLVCTSSDANGAATAGSGTTQRAYNSSWGLGIYDSNGTVASGSRSLVISNSSSNMGGVIASFAPAAAAFTPSPDLRTYFY